MTTKEMKALVRMARCYDRGEMLMEKTAKLAEHLITLEGMGADREYLKIKKMELDKNRQQAQNLLADSYDAHCRLEEIMGNIQDDYIYRLISGHYLGSRSWKNLALMIGGGNTADAVRKAAVRYLAKIEI